MSQSSEPTAGERLLSDLREVSVMVKDLITAGRQLQKDLRHDVREWRKFLETSVAERYDNIATQILDQLGVRTRQAIDQAEQSIIMQIEDLHGLVTSGLTTDEYRMLVMLCSAYKSHVDAGGRRLATTDVLSQFGIRQDAEKIMRTVLEAHLPRARKE